MLKKIKKQNTESIAEVKEGVSYSSNVGMDAIPEDSLTKIPSPISVSNTDIYVVFDIETTGFGKNSDITQISAKECSGIDDSSFSRYVIPRKDITIQASQVTGISYQRSCNKMYVHGKEVQCVSLNEALVDFLEFLQSKRSSIILVGHNISAFDIPVLMNRLNEFNLCGELCRIAKGFVDTLNCQEECSLKKK